MAVSSERRTALQAAMAAILGAAAAFGFITAEESQTYGVAGVALIGAVSSVWTAVNTWRQRPSPVEAEETGKGHEQGVE